MQTFHHNILPMVGATSRGDWQLGGSRGEEMFQVTEVLNFAVRQISDIETNIVAVERIAEYTTSPTEVSILPRNIVLDR
ncbi:hypothetical protein ANCCEY_14490 [Ancylostoma ceylanicum]|uniref:Uncharacterized protein n=1 Tax=Ancylostoma ceylanicum TaxID=53326 RepID=A0A0D6LFI8_9BILA|nr:hypothetical protein ANCCEY_14490 [Ancylostoma ceylanicum]